MIGCLDEPSLDAITPANKSCVCPHSPSLSCVTPLLFGGHHTPYDLRRKLSPTDDMPSASLALPSSSSSSHSNGSLSIHSLCLKKRQKRSHYLHSSNEGLQPSADQCLSHTVSCVQVWAPPHCTCSTSCRTKYFSQFSHTSWSRTCVVWHKYVSASTPYPTIASYGQYLTGVKKLAIMICSIRKTLYTNVYEYDSPLFHSDPSKFEFVQYDECELENPWKESFKQLVSSTAFNSIVFKYPVPPSIVSRRSRSSRLSTTIRGQPGTVQREECNIFRYYRASVHLL